MINPLRSEEDAFRFTLIVAVLVAPIVLAGLLFSSTAALICESGDNPRSPSVASPLMWRTSSTPCSD